MRQKSKDTIAAQATPSGQAGIGLIRVSGPLALKIADNIFSPKKKGRPSSFKSHTIHYGFIKDKTDNGGKVDEVLLSVMRSPSTYTREDMIEINCHGGQAVLDRVFALVCGSGARPAEPGEFTKRAFLNGRMDLAQAEAVADIINATTEASLRVAMSHLDGHFSEKIEKERLALIDVLKDVEAFVDFQEEHLEGLDLKGMDARIDKVMASLKDMLLTAGTGMMIKEGITCVICGKPNAGKSSLLNMLLKVERAIVTHVPGTTRDTIEESVDISGIAVKLVDTAGITHSRDIVEKKGIEKTKGYIKRADLILFVMDMSRPFDVEDRAIIKLLPKGRTIPIANKSDLRPRLDLKGPKKIFGTDALRISTRTGRGIKELKDLLGKRICGNLSVGPESFFVTSARHKKALEKAVAGLQRAGKVLSKGLPPELISMDIKQAVDQLGLITGQTVEVDILERIFSGFCIGK